MIRCCIVELAGADLEQRKYLKECYYSSLLGLYASHKKPFS